jgi:hypothetical protein
MIIIHSSEIRLLWDNSPNPKHDSSDVAVGAMDIQESLLFVAKELQRLSQHVGDFYYCSCWKENPMI